MVKPSEKEDKMSNRTYVVMARDELGDVFRPEGSGLFGTYTFPGFNEEEDPEMWAAFCAWEDSILNRVQEEWERLYGPECRLFLEETYQSQFNRMGGMF
jgi:hypothetical protein